MEILQNQEEVIPLDWVLVTTSSVYAAALLWEMRQLRKSAERLMSELDQVKWAVKFGAIDISRELRKSKNSEAQSREDIDRAKLP